MALIENISLNIKNSMGLGACETPAIAS